MSQHCIVKEAASLNRLIYRGDADWDSPIGRFLFNLEGVDFDDDGVMGSIIAVQDTPTELPDGVEVESFESDEPVVFAFETVGQKSGLVVPTTGGYHLVIMTGKMTVRK